jgi:hypothetical protein
MDRGWLVDATTETTSPHKERRDRFASVSRKTARSRHWRSTNSLQLPMVLLNFSPSFAIAGGFHRNVRKLSANHADTCGPRASSWSLRPR